jgi:hypothetical protein
VARGTIANILKRHGLEPPPERSHFMVIYRSTMSQANGFMAVLERINTVGMAVQVLDSIEDSDPKKNDTRAQMIGLLLHANISKSNRTSNSE